MHNSNEILEQKRLVDWCFVLNSGIYSNNKISDGSDIDIIEKWSDNDGSTNSNSNDFDDNKSDKRKKDDKKDKKMTIEYFGVDLNKEAKEGNLEPCIGREKEINQTIFTLLRKTKNNPMLIWEPWVGKTAIVEWLAQKIVNWEVPERLKNKRIIMLDMSSVVAWTKFRWDFEWRFKSIIDEAIDPTNNIILFIDEIHMVMWAWWANGVDDASQMLKPALARGKIKLIWATTFDEYQKYIEKDAALKRRFQEISVNEPNDEVTLQILEWIRHKYEDFHGVLIQSDAIEKSISLSKRYILNKYLPDKAIDLIDEACARKSTMNTKLENDSEYNKIITQIEENEKNIEKTIITQDYYKAAELKRTQDELKNKLQNIRNNKNIPMHMRSKISPRDIDEVIAEKIWIPLEVVSESEIEKLKRIEEDLNKKIIWQKEVVKSVVQSLQRNRLSIISRSKPIASFLFMWPSGTWKTYLAKLIAQDYFGDEKSLIRVDMSEYMEKYSSSKLIWSAPWYVWYDSGGMLTEQVRRRPYSVILFDEIEKADSDVLNILLQVLDEWQLKDSKWRIIDFKSTIIIMTSNIWHEEFNTKINKIWFGFDEKTLDKDKSESDFEEKKANAIEKMKKYLNPEFVSRIDKIAVFKPISKEDMTQIYDNNLKEFLEKRKTKENIKLPIFNLKKIQQIVDKIYDPAYWVRQIQKHIQEEIEPQIIEQLMKK